jgi:hypothetical protein
MGYPFVYNVYVFLQYDLKDYSLILGILGMLFGKCGAE